MSKSVLCEEKNNICLITLNEEDTRNAISPDIINELVSILEEIDNNKKISCNPESHHINPTFLRIF